MALGRKTGGRQKGTPNKVAADVRSLAQSFGPAAIAALAQMAGLTEEPGAEAEATRVVAIKELLDRAYGRATQPIGGDTSEPMLVEFRWQDSPPVAPVGEALLEPGDGADADDGKLLVQWRDSTC